MSFEREVISYTHQDHRAPAAPLRIVDWGPIAAVQGTGSLLLGPHEHGAQAIVPPGVLARTPRSWESEYSEVGWRLSIWEFLDEQSAYVEGSRPQRLTQPTFPAVVALVRERAPAYEDWLVRQVDQRILCLAVLIDNSQPDSEERTDWRVELDDLLLDATQAFGGSWVRHSIAPPAR